MAYAPGSKQAEAGGAQLQPQKISVHDLQGRSTLAASPQLPLHSCVAGAGMAGGGGGVPVPGLPYASVVGGWVSATLVFFPCAGAESRAQLIFLGTQVSYSMMSFWLFLAWAGCASCRSHYCPAAHARVDCPHSTSLAFTRWVIALGGLAGIQVQPQHVIFAKEGMEPSLRVMQLHSACGPCRATTMRRATTPSCATSTCTPTTRCLPPALVVSAAAMLSFCEHDKRMLG